MKISIFIRSFLLSRTPVSLFTLSEPLIQLDQYPVLDLTCGSNVVSETIEDYKSTIYIVSTMLKFFSLLSSPVTSTFFVPISSCEPSGNSNIVLPGIVHITLVKAPFTLS